MSENKIKVFSWGDGFYNVEKLKYNGKMWVRDGNMKCMTEKELEEYKERNKSCEII